MTKDRLNIIRATKGAIGPADAEWLLAEIERLRVALTSIKSMAAGSRQTMIASDILETARKALAGAAHEPVSARCIDCGGAREDHDDMSTFRPAEKSGESR